MKTVKGNLLDLADAGEFDIIVHGCNCFNTMGAGIAREIKARYPIAFSSDYGTTPGDINKLGTYTSAESFPNALPDKHVFRIINAYTQFRTASQDNPDAFEYASFDVILRKLAYTYPIKRFGFPMIGMGLAGGNKDRIMKSLENFAAVIEIKGGTVTLVEFG